MHDNPTDPRFYQFRNAAYSDLEETLRLLDADPTLINVRNSLGETALHFLAVENDLDAVRWLYEHGADINTRSNFGETPLMEAAGLGYVDLCRFLLEHGADTTPRSLRGSTALSSAARHEHIEILNMLLKTLGSGEDINAYFGPLDASGVFHTGGPVAELLTSLGLLRHRCGAPDEAE